MSSKELFTRVDQDLAQVSHLARLVHTLLSFPDDGATILRDRFIDNYLLKKGAQEFIELVGRRLQEKDTVAFNYFHHMNEPSNGQIRNLEIERGIIKLVSGPDFNDYREKFRVFPKPRPESLVFP